MTSKPLTFASWVLYTSFGWITGIVLYLLLTSISEQSGLQLHDGQSLVGIGLSAGVGLFQWMLIRKQSESGFKWFWSLFVGMSLPFIMVDLISAAVGLNPHTVALDVQIMGLLCTTIIGASLAGYFQYRFVLDKTEMASNWITYHSLSWMAGFVPIAVYLGAHTLGITRATALLIALLGGPLLGYFTARRIVRIFESHAESY